MDTTLVYGFIEAGKTTYIQESLLNDYFYKYGTTLVLCFEEGEKVYDEQALARRKVHVAYYEGGEDITAFCVSNMKEYHPDRVYVEMNCMIPKLRKFFPKEMEVRFTTTRIDFRTMELYLSNLRQYVNDMVKASDMVTFCNCASAEALAPYSQIFKLMNAKAVYLRQDPMGYHEKAFGIFLPYSLSEPCIKIGTEEFITFSLDAGEHPEHYDGKRLDFILPIEVRRDISNDMIRCGRTVMTCCMADLQFMGSSLMTEKISDEKLEGWIFLQAEGKIISDAYEAKRLALLPLKVEPASPPDPLLLKG